jgi:uncharacterized protein YehS (DUF1456 family)
MTNNDILRSLRYALALKDDAVMACFAEGGVVVTRGQLAALLAREEDPRFEPLQDQLLRQFLDGFVSSRRGKREPPADERRNEPTALSNNRILRALRIGLALKDTDVLDIMERAGTPLTKTELSALFRREDHRNYQPCGNQFLRTFLRGLGLWFRERNGISND